MKRKKTKKKVKLSMTARNIAKRARRAKARIKQAEVKTMPIKVRMKVVREFSDGRKKRLIMANVSKTTASKWVKYDFLSEGVKADGTTWKDKAVELPA